MCSIYGTAFFNLSAFADQTAFVGLHIDKEQVYTGRLLFAAHVSLSSKLEVSTAGSFISSDSRFHCILYVQKHYILHMFTFILVYHSSIAVGQIEFRRFIIKGVLVFLVALGFFSLLWCLF